MRRLAGASWVVCGLLLTGCVTGVEDLSSLADRPPLQCAVWITGGAFVQPVRGEVADGPLARTYASGSNTEVVSLDALRGALQLGKVFNATRVDPASSLVRRVLSELAPDSPPGASQQAALEAALDRARRAGCDFVLVAEGIQDGGVVSRGINDRWPFTIGAWLFALGALVPDRTYESQARLRVSIRDAHSGMRVFQQVVVRPGPVDLDMFDRCGVWGFVQSILVPPFFTSTKDSKVAASVRAASTPRLLTSLVRRLKSVEVEELLQRAGPAAISAVAVRDGLRLEIDAEEALSAIELRVDGAVLPADVARAFERALLASERRDGARFRYAAIVRPPTSGRLLRVQVQTEGARVRSATLTIGS
ncbi:MAG: hypothetical protein H6837_07270 [Planctomycetes bacterium]|nr:hypothetical protein [Planctomycetota bacterium]